MRQRKPKKAQARAFAVSARIGKDAKAFGIFTLIIRLLDVCSIDRDLVKLCPCKCTPLLNIMAKKERQPYAP